MPGLPALPESRLYALSHPTGKDLQWSLWTGVGAPQRRERATDPWTATPVDPLASDVAALDREVGPGARGLLTLTGTATLASYQTALRSITFRDRKSVV